LMRLIALGFTALICLLLGSMISAHYVDQQRVTSFVMLIRLLLVRLTIGVIALMLMIWVSD
jgi:hypothetical protein